MATILTRQHFWQIRKAIDQSLDTVSLPDDTIAMPIFQGRGESMVKLRDPFWDIRTGDALQHQINAAIFFTASLLITSLVRNSSETFGQLYAWKRNLIDPAVLATALVAQGDEEIDLSTGSLTSDTDEMPTMFALAQAWRPCR